MKNTMIAMLAAVSVILSVAIAKAEVIDKIVVVVNNDVITQGEVDRILIPIYQRLQTMYKGRDLLNKLDEARQSILGQLIEEKLIIAEAKKLNLEVTDREVADRLEEAQGRFESRQVFEAALADQRMSIKELKAKFRDQILSRKMIDQKVGARIIITPIDVSEYYRDHHEEFTVSEEIKLRCILIKPKEGLTPEQAEELANQLSERLKNGEDFAELARTYSDGPGASEGGIMGRKTRGDLMPEIEKFVFQLKEGESSGVLKTDLGYFIFKADEKTEAKTSSLSEARRIIEEAIYRERAREKMKGWIEGLKRNAYIAFK